MKDVARTRVKGGAAAKRWTRASRTRAVLLVAAAALVPGAAVLAGCRAVLGIEELDVVTEGGTAQSDGGSSADARADVLADVSVADATSDAVPANACAQSADCPKCCREDTSIRDGFGRLERFAADAGCVCAPGPCQSECASYVCGPPGGSPSPTCGACIDNQIRAGGGSPACMTARTRCAADLQGCKPALDCMTSCR